MWNSDELVGESVLLDGGHANCESLIFEILDELQRQSILFDGFETNVVRFLDNVRECTSIFFDGSKTNVVHFVWNVPL